LPHFIKRFLELESAGGLALMAAALVAMAAANSPLAESYAALATPSVTFWINDGLMSLFFLLVGLEIKRELREGELSTRAQAMLPCVAALAGVVAPALIYMYFTGGTQWTNGWAIPSATDIAFSLGVLSLLGSRVNPALKIFLMAVAVIDDIAAIVIIAGFYTDHLRGEALAAALLCAAALWACNRRGVARAWPYLLLGFLMWLATLASGVHATVAGVALGLLMPVEPLGKRMIGMLHPWVVFGVMPVFALANAGVPLAGMLEGSLAHPVSQGIALGLFFGKQAGIFLAVWLMVRLKLAPMPAGAGWLEIYAVSLLAGIGFTMSLFIGTLAFQDSDLQFYTRLGVICGSLFSALFGSLTMWLAIRRK
jgi:Na+:H+ antiporter, NhaA family